MGNSLKERFNKEYNSIDILKFVLSVFVMIIHSGINKTVISPILRIAVPLFFIISSYFFFIKNKKLTGKEKKGSLVHFVKRNLFLYLFWAILQFPVVMFMRGYLHTLYTGGGFAIVKDLILGNGFTGSWYIIASIVGMIVVYWTSKKLSARLQVLITLPLYIVCCIATNYWNLVDSSSIISAFCNGYYDLTGLYFYTSFPVALFWIALGRFLAEEKIDVKKHVLWIVFAILCILLALERYLIVRYSLATTDDCYFFLILLCPVVFLLIKKHNMVFNTKFRFREISVIIYVMHGCCERMVGYVLKMFPYDYMWMDVIKVLVSLLILVLLGHCLIFLRERFSIRFLKYAF